MTTVDRSLKHWKQLLVCGQDVLKSQQDITHVTTMTIFCSDLSQFSVSLYSFWVTLNSVSQLAEWFRSKSRKNHDEISYFTYSGFGKVKIKISKFKLNFITEDQPPITDSNQIQMIHFWFLVVARLFCCLSLLAGTIGAVIFLVGMSCTNLGSAPAAKRKMRLTSGIMTGIGGILIRKYTTVKLVVFD